MNVFGVDWSLKTGVAIAWREDRVIHTLRLPCVGESGASRLNGLYCAAGNAVTIAAENGLPTAVYYEQAFGMNLRMHEASGALQAGLWGQLVGRSAFPPNVWPILTKDWRQTLGIPRAEGATAKDARAERKRQQRVYAIGLGADPGLSEDEFDAVCILRAGELDIGEKRSAA